MPARWLLVIILLVPAILYASQEEDMELFEFLALYDQDDNAFIDAEIDERIETAQAAQVETSDNLSQEVKSESDE